MVLFKQPFLKIPTLDRFYVLPLSSRLLLWLTLITAMQSFQLQAEPADHSPMVN